MISSNLPSNTRLIDFESDYPSFSQIFVQKIVLDINGTEITAKNIQLKYDFSHVALEELILTITSATEPEIANTQAFDLESLKLPEINIQDFKFLDKIQLLEIAKIIILNQANSYQFSQLNFEHDDTNKKSTNRIKKLQLTMDLSSTLPDQQHPLKLKLFLILNPEKNKIVVKIKQKDKVLTELSHIQTQNNTTLKMQADLEYIQSLFPEFFIDLPMMLRDDTTVNWVQNDNKNITEINIRTSLSIPPGRFGLSNQIKIPLEIVISSELEEKLNAKIEIKGSTTDSFEFISEQIKISAQPISFNFETLLSLPNRDTKDLIIQLENTTLNLSSNKLNLDHEDSTFSFDKNTLKILIQNLPINLNKIEESNWQLNVDLSSENLMASVKQETQINSKMNLNFELIKSQNWLSSGKLFLSELQITESSYLLNGALSVNWQDIDSSVNNGTISLNLDAQNNRVTDFDFDSLTFKADLSLSNDQIEGNGSLLINEETLTPFSLIFNKETTNFSINLKEQLLANEIFNHFFTIIGERNKVLLQILEGQVVHSGDILLNEKLLVKSKFAIKDMLFQFGENEVQGFNMTQELISLEPLLFRSSLKIEKIDFSSGLAIDNVSAKISSSSSENIIVKDIKGALWEGQLLADELKFGSKGLKESVVELKHISLTELIFFMDVEGLYAEGMLDFSLPISMQEGNFSVKKGVFKTTEKGIIKYTAGGLEQKTEKNIALQALENFHYDSLDGTLSYSQAGEYHIKLHLVGSNPELYDGYPIDFVLNLQGELSDVFRSLFLTGNFDDAIMQQVKTDQLKQNAPESSLEQ